MAQLMGVQILIEMEGDRGQRSEEGVWGVRLTGHGVFAGFSYLQSHSPLTDTICIPYFQGQSVQGLLRFPITSYIKHVLGHGVKQVGSL